MRTQYLKGKAAEEAIMARGVLDWQAKKALATARLYGVNNIPVNNDRDVLGIEALDDGLYAIGPYKLVIK
jgi:hypothetical protein